MRNMWTLIREIVQKRNLIWDLAKADFRKRFVGSYFGVAWMFVQPVVTVLIYFFIFQMGFKSVPPIPGVPYVIWLVPGIVPWFFFGEALNGGTGCLQEYNYLVKKVVFNVSILPVLKILSCLIVHGIFALIMVMLFFAFGRLPMVTWAGILYYSFALSVLTLALSYITCSIQVFFKDMSQIVGIVLQIGMWMTPIMWDPFMFKDRPELMASLEKVLRINPVYYIVVGYRDSMLSGNWFWQRPGLTLYFWGITLILLWIGLRVFGSLKPHFSDVL